MNKNKQLTEKQIRKNVVLGIWQFIVYIVLGLAIAFLICLPFYFLYQFGYSNGHDDGLLKGWQGGYNDKYCDPCAERPAYCDLNTGHLRLYSDSDYFKITFVNWNTTA